MADTDSVRSRRWRQHRQGDHSLCRHGKTAAPVASVPGAVAGDLDPVGEMRTLAGQLAAACAADPGNAAIARELRLTLLALADVPEPPRWTVLDELRAGPVRWAEEEPHERPATHWLNGPPSDS
jgi:hypothetical protein